MDSELVRILMVEDEETDRMAVKRLFVKESLPYELEFAETATEGIERIREGGLDLVLIDYRLPDGTGFDVQKEVGKIPCIFMTVVDELDVAVRAMKAGAVDYIFKNADWNYLQLLPMSIQSALDHAKEVKARKEAEEKLQKLAIDLERRVEERTSELVKSNEKLQAEIAERKRAEEKLKRTLRDLEVFNKAGVGREMRMVDLKRKVNELAGRLGEPEPYDLSFAEKAGDIGERSKDKE